MTARKPEQIGRQGNIIHAADAALEALKTGNVVKLAAE